MKPIVLRAALAVLLSSSCTESVFGPMTLDAGPELLTHPDSGPVDTALVCVEKTECSSRCVDTRLDDSNCGGCDQVCGAGRECADSTCYPQSCPSAACAPGSVCVDGVHCREKACLGLQCASDETCSEGVCKARRCGALLCDEGSVCENGACVDVRCDNVRCPSGKTCVGGACVTPSCTDSSQNGTETDTNCGGSCPSCGNGLKCATATDCASRFCANHVCAACSSQSDCGANEACVNGVCATACAASSSCTGGEVCDADAGLCGPCRSATECPAGAGCGANQRCGACATAADCRAGEACANGVCGPCASPDQCASGLGCTSGGVCGACTSGAQCPQRQGCSDAGVCGACTSSDQCAPGLACIGGMCGACAFASQCAPGQACRVDAGVCGACTSAGDCRAGQGCQADAGGLCGACRQADDCAQGQVCRVDGTCGACTANRDCAVNSFCNPTGACQACTQPGQCTGPGYFDCGSGVCKPAGPGFYAPGDDQRYPCAAGRYCASSLNSTLTGDGPCVAGAACPAGSSSPTGAGVCGANTFSLEGAASCTACPINSSTTGSAASDHAGPSACKGNAGYYNCASGSCSPVGAGYFSPGGTDARTPCASGTYASSTTASSCSACTNLPAGATSAVYGASTGLSSNACPVTSVTCGVGFTASGATCTPNLPTCGVSVSPLTGTTADTFTASWSSNGASCTWSLDGVAKGSVACGGSSPLGVLTVGSHTVALTPTNAAGSTSCSKSFTVTAPPTTCSVNITPATPASGTTKSTYTASWASTGTTCSYSFDGVPGGAVNCSGSGPVGSFAAGNHTLVFTATGPGGPCTATKSFNVVPNFTCDIFPKSGTTADNFQISWAADASMCTYIYQSVPVSPLDFSTPAYAACSGTSSWTGAGLGGVGSHTWTGYAAGPTGNGTCNVTFTVTAAVVAPTCNASVTPSVGTSATTFTVGWASNADSCTWSYDGTPMGSIACNGATPLTGGAVGGHSVVLHCTKDGVTVHTSPAQWTVNAPTPPSCSVHISPEVGGSVASTYTVSWSSNGTSCNYSKDGVPQGPAGSCSGTLVVGGAYFGAGGHTMELQASDGVTSSSCTSNYVQISP